MDFSGLDGMSGAIYVLSMVFVALDALFPPLPAEVAVITAADLSARGDLNPYFTLLAAAVGSWLGDMLLYFLFRQRLASLFDRMRWGRRLRRRVNTAVARVGDASTFAALVAVRFLPAGRTASMAAAGLADIARGRAALASAIGSCLWAIWMFSIGWATGSLKDLPWWAGALFGTVIGLLCGAGAAVVLRFRSRRRQTHLPAGSGSHAPRP